MEREREEQTAVDRKNDTKADREGQTNRDEEIEGATKRERKRDEWSYVWKRDEWKAAGENDGDQRRNEGKCRKGRRGKEKRFTANLA